MTEPQTTLDARFSDLNAVATEWQETRGVLEAAELFWVSTVRSDGRPHMTPLVAVWLNGAVHFCTGAAEQKAVNAVVLGRLAEAWARKWDGRWRLEIRDGAFQHDGNTALVFSVHPKKVLAFAKGTFGQTRHAF